MDWTTGMAFVLVIGLVLYLGAALLVPELFS